LYSVFVFGPPSSPERPGDMVGNRHFGRGDGVSSASTEASSDDKSNGFRLGAACELNLELPGADNFPRVRRYAEVTDLGKCSREESHAGVKSCGSVSGTDRTLVFRLVSSRSMLLRK
jgi:hypothetical protein